MTRTGKRYNNSRKKDTYFVLLFGLSLFWIYNEIVTFVHVERTNMVADAIVPQRMIVIPSNQQEHLRQQPTNSSSNDNNNNNNNNNNDASKTKHFLKPPLVVSLPKNNNNNNKYLPEVPYLNVPFYMYEELWTVVNEATLDKVSIHEVIRDRKVFGGSPKHDDDYHFIMSAYHHPMRTNLPEEAQLFVVPILFNLLVTATMYSDTTSNSNSTMGLLCWKNICNRQLLQYAHQVLEDSIYFQQSQGNNHLITLPFFHWDHHKINIQDFNQSLLQCHVLSFGDIPVPSRPDRLNLPTMYVGEACSDTSTTASKEKLYDLVLVATIKSGIKFRPRRNVCDWVEAHRHEWVNRLNQDSNSNISLGNNNNNNNTLSMPFCGKGDRCPALAQSRLGFHVRGDSASSSRLFDTLLSGTVPIFTQDKQYWAVPDFYDWNAVSYFANAKNHSEFVHSMSQILQNDNLPRYAERLANVIRNRNLFDWESGTPFDIYMYRLQVHLWPETRHHHHPNDDGASTTSQKKNLLDRYNILKF